MFRKRGRRPLFIGPDFEDLIELVEAPAVSTLSGRRPLHRLRKVRELPLVARTIVTTYQPGGRATQKFRT